MKKVLIAMMFLSAIGSQAEDLRATNTFFIGASCGKISIQNPSNGSNPYMQNTKFSVLLNEANGKLSFHELELSIESNVIVLLEKPSDKSNNLKVVFNKDEVFVDRTGDDQQTVSAIITAQTGSMSGTHKLDCNVSWSEVIGKLTKMKKDNTAATKKYQGNEKIGCRPFFRAETFKQSSKHGTCDSHCRNNTKFST